MSGRGMQTQSDVLEVLRGADAPMSAYDILASLRAVNPRMAAPTIYRALSALSGAGRIHRIESLNAWAPCAVNGCRRTLLLSVCDACGAVAEGSSPELSAALEGLAKAAGFRASRHVLEAHGRCADCAKKDATA